jgi:predicted nucleic acid-binding protein
MPDDKHLLYWDSNVFLSHLAGYPDRIAMLDAIRAEVSNSKGTLGIITSVVAVTEVAYVVHERQRGALDPEVERRIDEFWADTATITLVEYHVLIAREARWLIREAVARGWSLRALDAIHLATARRLHAREFHTYDDRLDKFSAILGLPVLRPRTQIPEIFGSTGTSVG